MTHSGSGKSSGMAAILNALKHGGHRERSVLTYQAPVEYVYDQGESPEQRRTRVQNRWRARQSARDLHRAMQDIIPPLPSKQRL